MARPRGALGDLGPRDPRPLNGRTGPSPFDLLRKRLPFGPRCIGMIEESGDVTDVAAGGSGSNSGAFQLCMILKSNRQWRETPFKSSENEQNNYPSENNKL